MIEHIQNLESQLIQAMIDSNCDILSCLLSDKLVFTDFMGNVHTKEDDIRSHKNGIVKINNITCEDQRICCISNVAIVSVIMNISGIFAGTPASGKFRFTRIWHQAGSEYKLIAGHSTKL